MTTKSDIKSALRRLNVWLAKFVRNVYFDGIPVSQMAQALEDHGFEASELEGIYCGREGRHTAAIGHGKHLHFTWYKMEATGRYEIVAYAN